jgi:hypothetical protein
VAMMVMKQLCSCLVASRRDFPQTPTRMKNAI